MRIPEETYKIQDWMIERINYERWIEFCERFGGRRWWIPMRPTIAVRNAEIKKEYEEFLKVPGIGKENIYLRLGNKYSLSPGGVRRIIKGV